MPLITVKKVKQENKKMIRYRASKEDWWISLRSSGDGAPQLSIWYSGWLQARSTTCKTVENYGHLSPTPLRCLSQSICLSLEKGMNGINWAKIAYLCVVELGSLYRHFKRSPFTTGTLRCNPFVTGLYRCWSFHLIFGLPWPLSGLGVLFRSYTLGFTASSLRLR